MQEGREVRQKKTGEMMLTIASTVGIVSVLMAWEDLGHE